MYQMKTIFTAPNPQQVANIMFQFISICCICLLLLFSGCDADPVVPPSNLQQVTVTWDYDVLSPSKVWRFWPLAVTAAGNLVYVGGYSGSVNGALFRYQDGNWEMDKEAGRIGFGFVVGTLVSNIDGDMLALGGENGDCVGLYTSSGGWSKIAAEYLGAPIRRGTMDNSGYIYVATTERVVKYVKTKWIELFNYNMFSGYDTLNQRIEVISIAVKPGENSVYLMLLRQWLNRPSRKYLLEIATNGTRTVDSLDYPLTDESRYNFGTNLHVIDDEIYSIGYGLYKLENGVMKLVTKELTGVWLAGSINKGLCFAASPRRVYCYFGGIWTDVTPKYLGTEIDPYPLQGLAFLNSVIYLSAMLNYDSTIVYKGKVEIY
jgi:hypothetical protein